MKKNDLDLCPSEDVAVFTDEQKELIEQFMALNKGMHQIAEKMTDSGIIPSIITFTRFKPETDAEKVQLVSNIAAYGGVNDLNEMIVEMIDGFDTVKDQYMMSKLIDIRAMIRDDNPHTIMGLLFNAFTVHRIKNTMAQVIDALNESNPEKEK